MRLHSSKGSTVFYVCFRAVMNNYGGHVGYNQPYPPASGQFPSTGPGYPPAGPTYPPAHQQPPPIGFVPPPAAPGPMYPQVRFLKRFNYLITCCRFNDS